MCHPIIRAALAALGTDQSGNLDLDELRAADTASRITSPCSSSSTCQRLSWLRPSGAEFRAAPDVPCRW
jgi:hypothetical protein